MTFSFSSPLPAALLLLPTPPPPPARPPPNFLYSRNLEYIFNKKDKREKKKKKGKNTGNSTKKGRKRCWKKISLSFYPSLKKKDGKRFYAKGGEIEFFLEDLGYRNKEDVALGVGG